MYGEHDISRLLNQIPSNDPLSQPGKDNMPVATLLPLFSVATVDYVCLEI